MKHTGWKRLLCATTALLFVVGLSGCATHGSWNNERSFFKQSVKSEGTNFYKQTAKRFDGTYRIKTITLNADSNIDVALEIESGDYRLVLVNMDKAADRQEILLLDHNYNGALDLSGIAPGEYALKMIGDKAAFRLRIDFSQGVVSDATKTSYALNAENYDGVYPIQTLTVDSNTVIDANVSVQSGAFRLVFVQKGGDGREIRLLDGDHDGTLDLTAVAPGEYTLQMVCEQASFRLRLVFAAA